MLKKKCCKEQEAKHRKVSKNICDVTRRVFVSNPHDTSEQEQDDFFHFGSTKLKLILLGTEG